MHACTALLSKHVTRQGVSQRLTFNLPFFSPLLSPSFTEELYEELELEDSVVPPVPPSPRPSRPNVALPSTPAQDDFAIDEDIYEETDDILPSMPPPQLSPQHQAPSLPNRNPTKNSAPSGPLPSLPPRNAPAASASPGPSLPPRSGPGGKMPKPPVDYEAAPPKIGAKPKSKPQAPPPPVADEDQELYDDVIAGEVGEEAEEMYDDVVVGEEDPGEELYDDVMTTSGIPTTTVNSSAKPAPPSPAVASNEPISEEFYEDMAPTAVSDSYVAMEKSKEEELEPGDELYMDVDIDEQPPPQAPPPVQKVQASITAKSSSRISSPFSKIKKPGGSGGGSNNANRGLVSGTISYKAPKKYKFDERWGCVEGTNCLVFKSSSDKRHQDKIPLGDCRLDIGSTEAGAGKFAFSLSKGDKFYHFSLHSQADVDNWVGVLKGIVKYAPVETPADNGTGPEEDLEVYQAREDHIADADGELTFKKGTIIKLIDRPSKDMWYGQIGNESQVFTGKKGKFPAHKVEIAEDLYI